MGAALQGAVRVFPSSWVMVWRHPFWRTGLCWIGWGEAIRTGTGLASFGDQAPPKCAPDMYVWASFDPRLIS